MTPSASKSWGTFLRAASAASLTTTVTSASNSDAPAEDEADKSIESMADEDVDDASKIKGEEGGEGEGGSYEGKGVWVYCE